MELEEKVKELIKWYMDKCIGEQMDKLMDTFTGDADY